MTNDAVPVTAGPFHVSRSSDGTKHWFSARDEASGVTIPAKDRDDAYAMVSSLNRACEVYAARHRGSTAGVAETISCGVPNDDIAKMRELIAHTERHLPKMPWRVIPSDGKPTIAGRERSGNLFRGYIATWKEADLACLAVNSLPSLLDEVEMLRTIVFDALKYRTAGGMRKALEPALFAAHRAAHVAHASLSQTPATPMVQEGLREAATALIENLSSTYTARNGREVGIQGDDGEKCYIIHSDFVFDLRRALSATPAQEGER